MKSIDSRWIRSAVTVFVALFFVSALPWRELRADAITHGEYDCSPLSVTYDQISSWDTTTQAEFTVTNISELAVEGWTFELDYPMDVTVSNIWNAVDLTGEEPSLVVGNQEYNSTIAPGESITFGIILEGVGLAPTAPSSVTLVIEAEEEITEISEEIADEPCEEPVESDAFSYAVFTSGDISISGYMSNIYGDIYSGTNFIFQGSELNVEGTVRTAGSVNASGYITEIDSIEENTESLELHDLEEYIAESSADKEILSSEAFVSQTDIVANGYYYTEDSIEINSASLSGEAVIVAEEDITINADTITEDTELILYSVNGDITINATEAQIKGVLYAPEGKVTVNANDVSVIGNIVANELEFNGSVLNISVDEDVVFPAVTPTEVPEITVTDTPVPSETPEATATPTAEPTATSTPTPTVTVVPTLTETPTPTVTVTPTPTEAPIDTELDSDLDGIPDYLEEEIGTNPNNPDTDSDGLGDYLEIMVGYDPTKADTDDNGISDGDEDLDGDNVSNIVELSLGTELMSVDTDCDGINDGDELYVYCSNPKVPDTDGDGIYDGDELLLGKDPTDSGDGSIKIEQSKEQELSNEADPAITSVEVTMELSNVIDRSLKIRDMYNVDVYTTNVAGRVGSPISFECAEEFDTAMVVIRYDETKLGDTREENLEVLWYDEIHGIFVEQDQAITDTEADTISMELEHFSEYVVVDREQWDGIHVPVYTLDDQTETNIDDKYYDFYFVLINDETPENERNEYIILRNFIYNMRAGDTLTLIYSLVDHKDQCTNYWRFTNTANTLAESLELLDFAQYYLDSRGYDHTSDHFAVQAMAALDYRLLFREFDNEAMLFIVERIPPFMEYHDDQYFAYGNHAGYVAPCECDILDCHFPYVEYYYYPESMNLWDAFAERRNIRFMDFEDTDNDGIPDIVEEDGMYALDRYIYYSDPTNVDSDGDTLNDGEEMGMHRVLRIDEDTVQIDRANLLNIDEVGTSDFAYLESYIPENPNEISFVFDVNSDPMLKDSDGDYYYDAVDPNPMESGLETINLGGGSYNPFMEDLGYIHVCNVPNNLVYTDGNEELCDRVFYGGNQSWFGNITEDNLGIFQGDKLFIEESGCGMIATNDTMLYINYGGSTLSWEDYRETVLNTYDDFFIVGFDEVYWGSSIPSTMVCNAFERNSIETRTIRVNESNSSDTIGEIIESLNSDTPVILFENDAFWYDGIALYRPIFYGTQYSSFDGFINSFDDTKTQNHYHYTTITGVVECIDEVGNKHYWLRVQSWGDQCYVSYEEFVDFNNSAFKQGILIFPER